LKKRSEKVEIQLNSSSNPKAPRSIKKVTTHLLKKLSSEICPNCLPQYSHLRVWGLSLSKRYLKQVDPKKSNYSLENLEIKKKLPSTCFAALRELDKKEN
jgi:hypothetical protein